MPFPFSVGTASQMALNLVAIHVYVFLYFIPVLVAFQLDKLSGWLTLHNFKKIICIAFMLINTSKTLLLFSSLRWNGWLLNGKKEIAFLVSLGDGRTQGTTSSAGSNHAMVQLSPSCRPDCYLAWATYLGRSMFYWQSFIKTGITCAHKAGSRRVLVSCDEVNPLLACLCNLVEEGDWGKS